MAEEKTLLLTQEAYDKMKEELAWREGEYRDDRGTDRQAAQREDSDRAQGRRSRRRFFGDAGCQRT